MELRSHRHRRMLRVSTSPLRSSGRGEPGGPESAVPARSVDGLSLRRGDSGEMKPVGGTGMAAAGAGWEAFLNTLGIERALGAHTAIISPYPQPREA